ncbi:MAG: PEP-CTERM sorting domain-containing protein [Opitutaceae bacterium]|nr:PEP-CTERM sorting domain-containing protein [Opitutaceae bacterium]
MNHLPPPAFRLFAFISVLGISFAVMPALIQAADTDPVPLVNYPFTFFSGDSSDTSDKPRPRNVVDGLEASSIAWAGSGGGIGSGNNNNIYVRMSGSSSTYARTVAATEAAAIECAENDTLPSYWSVTLTPDEGQLLNLSTLVASVGAQTLSGAPSGDVITAGFFIRSSRDDYATSIANDQSGTPLVTVTGGGALTPVTATFSLAGSLYQNITTPVTFRIYAFATGKAGEDKTAYNETIRLAGVTVNGNMALATVPEPAAMAALCGGFAAAWFLLRKRR